MPASIQFDREKLEVYQRELQFRTRSTELLIEIRNLVSIDSRTRPNPGGANHAV